MRVLTTPAFRKRVKRLHPNQKADLDRAVRRILSNPAAGDAKAGDLAGVRVYKFRLVNQLTLLAYELSPGHDAVILLSVGSHENFYRDLKTDARPKDSQ